MPGLAITIRDETTSPDRPPRSFSLHVASERISVRELILRRVTHEVEERNRTRSPHFAGLVQPTAAVPEAPGCRLPADLLIDAEEQCRLALEAFGRRRFLLLVDRRQVEALDEEVVVTPRTVVRFLKIVPLVGG